MSENKLYDVFISYSTGDKMIVTQIVEALHAQGLNTFSDEQNIRNGKYIGESIINGLNSCRGVVFFISPNSINSEWVKQEEELALALSMRGEIKFLIPVMLRKVDNNQLNAMLMTRHMLDFSDKDLHIDEVLKELSEQLARDIRSYLPGRGQNDVDMPFVVLAMTRKEAEELLHGKVPPVNPGKFADLQEKLADMSYPAERLLSFYGDKRDDWRSPLCQVEPDKLITIKSFIEDVVKRLNDAARTANERYIIDPQFRSDDFTDENLTARTKAHKELEDRCVLVVDSLSLFHPALANFLDRSPLAHRVKNVVPIAVPPPYYRPAEPIDELIENAMREMMALSYDRFENELDLLCEFGISHPRALKRWLFAALPRAAKNFSRQSPRDDNRSDFREGRWQ